MKTQPQNGVGQNFLKRLDRASEFTETPHQKQSSHNSDNSNRCKCANDNSPSNRAVNITAGMYDAVDLRKDISATDLLKRYQHLMRSGNCRSCANEYIVGFFTKLDLIDMRERRNGVS